MNTEETATQPEITNPFEYRYQPNDMVQIPANTILNLLFFCEKVIASQPNIAVPYCYPTDVKEKKDKEGKLVKVDVKWEQYPAVELFLNTINNPIPVATEVSIIAEQVSYTFLNLHLENIEKGIAKKLGELTKEAADAIVEEKLKVKK